MKQIPILFEDDVLLVLDKPAGITVNKSDTTKNEETVQDFTESYLKFHLLSPEERAECETLDESGYKNAYLDRGGIVHRLDKETSGILLVAKNPIVFLALQKQFRERTIEKGYIALVHGVLIPQVGEISIPVDRLPWNRKRFGIVPGGRPSFTSYKTEMIYQTKDKHPENVSLVALKPKTGRTHQIRVHMQYLNRPIFSDFLYGGRKTSRDDRKILERVFLHAAQIQLHHPVTNAQITFESPLPVELQQFINERLIVKLPD